ncbi:Transposase A from transposon Tn554 [Bacillus thuringiensis serovar tochigiensis BGSC 4Y1]|nr:Transposase A from transposon Tn554 [Bacillus thuringiensis serovar tochigiensis BGSC 4Y1]
MDFYFEYIAEIYTHEVDTDHVFIKLSGENKYHPLEYSEAVSLFKRLKIKTGIHVTPHMLHYTSLTELRKSGWKDEHLMGFDKPSGIRHIKKSIFLVFKSKIKETYIILRVTLLAY